MLAAVRRSARSWAAAVILFIALVAIVVTGFGTGGFGGLGSLGTAGQQGQTLATVGDRRLTESEVNDVITRQFTQARQQQPQLGMAEFVAEAFDSIVEQMIVGVAIDHFADEQGLRVSDRMIDREIAGIAAFQDAAGRFDDATFRRALQAQGITEARLRQDIARSLLQKQLLGPIARGGYMPQGVVREYANLMLERRRGNIGVVPAELMKAGINPTPAEVAAFYRRNTPRFTIPERRVVRYAMIGAEQIAAAARATDQEIAAFYRQNQASYGPRETRDLQQIVLGDQAAAQRFAQRVRGGGSFAQAAQEAGFAVGDITASNQTRDAFARTTTGPVANAAFGAAEGTMVGPIRSELGFHFVRVERINRTEARPLAAVRDEIARTIEQRKQVDALGTLIGRIEDRIADGASLTEIAQAERLNLVTTAPITATGQVPGQPAALTPDLLPIVRAAFDVDPEAPEPLVEQIQPNQRYALVGIERVVAAAPPPLSEIQSEVRDALITQRALERARTVANQIAERINRGMAPAQAFAQAGMPLPPPRAVDMVRTEVNRAQGQVSPAQLVLFVLPEGRARAIPAPNGWFVVHHAQRIPGDAGSDEVALREMRRNLQNDQAGEIAEQFARAIERASGAERNEEAIAALRTRLLSNAIE